jgi:hypothetical protein
MGIRMKYPEDFVARVRAAFPDYPDIERSLEHDDDILGSILDVHQVRFSPNEIVDAFETGKTDELLARAKEAQRVWELYREWGELQVGEMKARRPLPSQRAARKSQRR